MKAAQMYQPRSSMVALAVKVDGAVLAAESFAPYEDVCTYQLGYAVPLTSAIAIEGALQELGHFTGGREIPALLTETPAKRRPRESEEDLPPCNLANSNLARAITPGKKNTMPRGRRSSGRGK